MSTVSLENILLCFSEKMESLKGIEKLLLYRLSPLFLLSENLYPGDKIIVEACCPQCGALLRITTDEDTMGNPMTLLPNGCYRCNLKPSKWAHNFSVNCCTDMVTVLTLSDGSEVLYCYKIYFTVTCEKVGNPAKIKVNRRKILYISHCGENGITSFIELPFAKKGLQNFKLTNKTFDEYKKKLKKPMFFKIDGKTDFAGKSVFSKKNI